MADIRDVIVYNYGYDMTSTIYTTMDVRHASVNHIVLIISTLNCLTGQMALNNFMLHKFMLLSGTTYLNI